jgi:hypothetical protein
MPGIGKLLAEKSPAKQLFFDRSLAPRLRGVSARPSAPLIKTNPNTDRDGELHGFFRNFGLGRPVMSSHQNQAMMMTSTRLPA